jgi:hypothetical protein
MRGFSQLGYRTRPDAATDERPKSWCHQVGRLTPLIHERNGGLQTDSSGSTPLVPVVKTADLRYGKHRSEFRRLHRPWFWGVLI